MYWLISLEKSMFKNKVIYLWHVDTQFMYSNKKYFCRPYKIIGWEISSLKYQQFLLRHNETYVALLVAVVGRMCCRMRAAYAHLQENKGPVTAFGVLFFRLAAASIMLVFYLRIFSVIILPGKPCWSFWEILAKLGRVHLDRIRI